MSAVGDELAGLDLSLLVADRSGLLVQTVGGAQSRIGAQVEQRGLIAGADLSEEKLGFNGIGTALETGRGITVDGDEHFVAAFREFSCFGIPIIHPGSKRLEGALNVTAPTEATSSLLEGFGRTMVHQIEQQLLQNTYRDEYSLMSEFLQASRGTDQAVCAISEETVMSNQKAEGLLEHIDYGALRRAIGEARRARSSQTSIEVSSDRLVAVDIQYIRSGGEILTLHPLWQKKTRIPRGRPRANVTGDVWGDRLKTVQGRSGSVAVVGEPGSGRTSAACEASRPLEHTLIDCVDLQTAGAQVWSKRLQKAVGTTARALIIDNVDLLPAAQLSFLRQLVSDDDSTARIVITADSHSAEADERLRSVLSVADHHVEVPPLRKRVAEFPILVEALAHKIAGKKRFIFSASAVQGLARAHWPGNLVQLRKVLMQVLSGRASGQITLSDLPEAYRGDQDQPLLGLDRAERAAIVEAMAAAEGNKNQAARALGMSRTTLYRRLRSLKINC
ncbi:MAG: hypothetical protein L0J19_15220 [Brevibacterium sp.]|nr:hypothetical protein [Brevibacterium sp.]MDN6190130.1 hypothetical protein [Brevibacterium sp.]